MPANKGLNHTTRSKAWVENLIEKVAKDVKEAGMEVEEVII